MIRRLALMLPLALAFGAGTARAEVIFGASGPGIYQYDTLTGAAATLTFATQNGVLANDLAVNATGTRFYYSDTSGNASGGLYVYNATTGVQTQFTSTGMTSTQLASGGTWYNGSYYAGIADPLLPSITKYTFAADGTTLLSTTTITPSNFGNLGDFGDFAINPSTGLLYGESQNFNGSGQSVFFSLDPSQANPFVTVINNTESGVYQLAFDNQGHLYATNNTDTADLFQISLTTGNATVVASNPFGFSPTDLAGPVPSPTVVPEPASLAMATLGLGMVALLSRHRSRRAKS